MMDDKALDEIAGAFFPESVERFSRCRAAVGRAYDLGRVEERKACADIADNALRACITDEERDIATTVRNLILARGFVLDARGEGEKP